MNKINAKMIRILNIIENKDLQHEIQKLKYFRINYFE